MPSVIAKGLGRIFFPDSMSEAQIADAMASKSQELLNMSSKARSARAQEMGFDVDKSYYHGTTADIDEFKLPEEGRFGLLGKGIYLTDSTEKASKFASKEGGSIIPSRVRGKLAGQSDVLDATTELGESVQGLGYKKEKELINRQLEKNGFVGIDAGQEVMVFDPSNIRSVSAAFDPALKESSNLLASVGAGAVPLAATLYTPEQNKAMADRLKDKGLGHLIPTGDKIEPEEFPKLEFIADFLDENTQTPFGPAFEGISAYLRGFGEDADAKQRAKRAMGAALDLI